MTDITVYILQNRHNLYDVSVYGSLAVLTELNPKESIGISKRSLYEHDFTNTFENGYVTIKKTKLIQSQQRKKLTKRRLVKKVSKR